MDEVLHAERWASGGPPAVVPGEHLHRLPDGAMVEQGGQAFARRGGHLLPWDFYGYGAARNIGGTSGSFRLITPKSTIAVLDRGYSPH